jgi:hypothetical protein
MLILPKLGALTNDTGYHPQITRFPAQVQGDGPPKNFTRKNYPTVDRPPHAAAPGVIPSP